MEQLRAAVLSAAAEVRGVLVFVPVAQERIWYIDGRKVVVDHKAPQRAAEAAEALARGEEALPSDVILTAEIAYELSNSFALSPLPFLPPCASAKSYAVASAVRAAARIAFACCAWKEPDRVADELQCVRLLVADARRLASEVAARTGAAWPLPGTKLQHVLGTRRAYEEVML